MSSQRHNIGIDFISVFGMAPTAHVVLANALGCTQVSMALAPFTANPHGYKLWSLRDDADLRRDLKTALQDAGVTIGLGEGFLQRPELDIASFAADMDIMADLGAAGVNIVALDPDLARSFDQLAHFASMAKARGLHATLEFLPGMPIGDLSSAVAAVRHAGAPHFRLLLDAMHVFRSGATAADLAALDPALIGYVQLCDAPLFSTHASYGEEARSHRLPPGKGELPLIDLLAVAPGGVTIGLEIPMLSDAEDGVGPYERLAPCAAAARTLLERARVRT